jgi:nucleoside-diphosphate-sugar epimerase
MRRYPTARTGNDPPVHVVVVGATGNVGTSVVERLVQDPGTDSVVGVARRLPASTPPKVRWRRADIGVDPLDDIVGGADAVIHLGWMIQPQHDEATMARTNVVGTMRLAAAAGRAGVGAFVYASSVGTYAPGPKAPLVDERWPATGVDSSSYSRHKAMVEAMLDEVERTHPSMRVVRMRTSLVFQRRAASEIGRLFLGPLVPRVLLAPGRLPFVPRARDLVFQATHATDVADAYWRATTRDVRGAFNIAAGPILDGDVLARTLESRPLPVPIAGLRALLFAAWRARLVPLEEGWIDMATRTPLMDSTRATTELGWEPRVTATDAVRELFVGFAERAGGNTPPLATSA